MAKKCFLSFHYALDCWRVQQVKQMGAIEEQPLLSSNKWEEVKKGGDEAIKKWIDDNMKGKSCLVVLVGEKTAGRSWVNYEIKKAWKDGLGVMAIRIHNLADSSGKQAGIGGDPFAGLTVDGVPVKGKIHNPPFLTSTYVYNNIAENIEDWVKAAIDARK